MLCSQLRQTFSSVALRSLELWSHVGYGMQFSVIFRSFKTFESRWVCLLGEVVVALTSKNSLVSALFGELSFTASKITFMIWVSSGFLVPRVNFGHLHFPGKQ